MKKSVFEVVYSQRFKGSSSWCSYKEKIVAPHDDAEAAALRMKALAFEEDMDGKACSGVKITAVTLICHIDRP